jgi:uracil-DNA glycosylase family 4
MEARKMERQSEGQDGIRQLLIQQLESLQRSGVLNLPRKASNRAAVATPVATAKKSGESTTLLAPETPKIAESPSEPKAVPEMKAVADSSPKRQKNAAGNDRESALAAMQIEVAACRRCEHLACTRTQTVFGVGNQRPRLCFMGEAPGADEDRRGEPFVGRAGQLLTDIIEKGMQLKRSDVYILNVLKCRPPDNRVPTDEEIANCREYFERQLELLQPEFICCLGATAARALLNTKQALGRARGQWFTYGNSRVMVTYHPSYLLRNPPAKKDTWEDIQMLMREMGLPLGKM